MSYFSASIPNQKEIKINTNGSDETRDLGIELGKRLKPDTVILLTGDLGSGKTTFVKGLARGLGVPESYYVTSPTYTIVNEYPGRLYLYHMDLYRISDPDELYDIGVEEMFNSGSVIAVEWPERLPDGIYQSHINITIDLLHGDSRIFTFIFSDVDLGP